METPDKNKVLEDQVRELVDAAFLAGGLESVRALEELFTREAARIRNRAQGGPDPKTLTVADVHRERYKEIIGNSPAMLRIFALMDRVADSTVPILIQGESGTGKELIARALHRNSDRRDKDYVTENCAAIPETLLESELFGYKRGAFTGAEKNKPGLFVTAHGGTLFLDEIGDMSMNMQKKLLRVLQDGEIRPVGGNAVTHVDVRVLSASNKNLQAMSEQGSFRQDLYFRLNTITLELPPLRERKVDIPELAEFFIQRIAGELGIEPVPLTPQALEALCRYRWPGNIRELENEIRRCLALKGDGKIIDLDGLSDDVKNC